MSTTYCMIDAGQLLALERVQKILHAERRLDGDAMRDLGHTIESVVRTCRELPVPDDERPHYLLCSECVDKLGPGEEKCCGHLMAVSCDRCGKYVGTTGEHCMPQHAPPYFLASRPPGPYLVRMRQDPGGRSYGIEVRRYIGRHWQSFGTDDIYMEGMFMHYFVILGPVPTEITP